MITHVKTVAVYVADQPAALRFFTDKLGFELRRSESMGTHGDWIELAPPGAETRLVLYPRGIMTDWSERKPSIVFGCDDIQATYQELSNNGVNFTQEPKKMAWGTFAIFSDPEGNEFVLSEGR